MASNQDVENLLDRITTQFGTKPERWFQPEGYQSIGLAVLDSIYSTGNRYSGVLNVVNRYRKLRIDEGSNPETDTATDLIDAFQRWGGVEGFVLNTKNQWKTSTQPHAPYKACAALEAATILADHSIETVSDVAEHLDSPDKRKNSDIAKHWLAIKGQRSGLTWHYFLMLVGVPGIKADRMIIRFATQALGYTQDVSPKEAVRLIEEVAESMRVNYTHLDHTIWRYQSGRPYLQANRPFRFWGTSQNLG